MTPNYKIKRYLLFRGSSCPDGGWDDLVNDYDTLEEINNELKKKATPSGNWYHIIDLVTREMTSGSI